MALLNNEKNAHITAGAANSVSSETVPSHLHPKVLTRKQKLAASSAIVIVLVLISGLLAGQQIWINISLPLLPVKAFTVPPDWRVSQGGLRQIIPGPDGNLWFLSLSNDWIGRITPKGVFSNFPTSHLAIPLWTTLERGPDGNLWANAFSPNGLWRLDPHTGALKAYNYFLDDLVVAHDGSVWFKEDLTNSVGHLDLRTGAIRRYPIAPEIGHLGCCTGGITEAANGEIWFATGGNEVEEAHQVIRIVRLDPRVGTITSFPIPATFLSTYQIMAPAIDGSIWLLCGASTSTSNVHYPVHVSPTGVVTIYRAPNGGDVRNLTLAPNGALWITYLDPTVSPPVVLARLTAGGTITPVGRLPGEEPHNITFGPDHHLWITTEHTIERVDVSA